MKKLVAVAIAVVAVIALGVYLRGSLETTVAPASAPEQSSTQAEDIQTQPGPAPTRADSPPVQSTRAQMPTWTQPEESVIQPTASNGALPRQRVSLLTKEEERRLDACREAWQRKEKGEQEARDAEAKDPAWAYRMEEKLREFTARRLQSVATEVTAIECKTTFCELRAQSFTPEAAQQFNDAMSALGQQPHGDFQGVSWSISEKAGKTLHAVQINRPQEPMRASQPPSANEVACWKVASLPSERERAARDAEDRDTGWADPMEQLLRQHINTLLAKYPLASLEISCKTTFCRIKAGGQGAQSREAFQKVSNEIGSEPWANMLNGDSGGSGYGDRWEGQLTLYRRD